MFDTFGTVDDVRIYNRALGATEVAKLSQSGAVKFTTSSVNLQQGSTLANGLVGHWTFDGPDTTDRIYDRSGQNNHGYFNGGATSSAKVIGKLGQALNFDGSNDDVRVPFSSTLEPAVVSFGGWVNVRTSTANTDDRIIGSVGGATGYGVVLNDDFHGCASTGISVFVAASGDFCLSYTSFALNTWYHVMATYDGVDTMRMYVNGAQVAIDTNVGGAISYGSDPFCFGDEPTGATCSGNPFAGALDDVRVYNRALTSTEVKQLYQLGTVIIRQ